MLDNYLTNTVNYVNQSKYDFTVDTGKIEPMKLKNKNTSQEPGKIIKPPNLKRIPKKELTKDDFIKLFITQLEYQDPMKPIDNNEMAMQLALFNQVDQLFDINQNLKTLMNNLQDFTLGYAANFIGKKVEVNDNTGWVENGKFLGGKFTLDEPANKVDITIMDSSGKVVKHMELTNLSKGTHEIDWDATDNNGKKVPDGAYKFTITIPNETDENSSTNQEVKTISPKMYAKVTGIKIDGNDIELILNNESTIKMSKLAEILGGDE